MNDIKKLPVWARQEIEHLQGECRRLERRATAWEKQEHSRVCIPHYGGVLGQAKFLPDDLTYRFSLNGGKDYVDVRFRHGALELMANDGLLISPQANNLAHVFVGRMEPSRG